MPRTYDIIISDIDGCLGPESHAPLNAHRLTEIAAYNRSAIERHDRPVVTVCSGRPQPFAEAMCRFLGNDAVPCVAENGVWIYDPRLNRFEMDPAITPEHRHWVREATRWIEADHPEITIQPGKSASLSLWHADTPMLMSLMPPLRERFTREGWRLRVSNTVAWINCDLEHVSKGTGIRRLVATTGTPKARLAGIGDMMNDLAIRENVAFFACPKNAAPALKAHADYISPHEEVEGVIDILGRLAR